MNTTSAAEIWRSTFRQTFGLYRSDDSESATIRARHLGDVVRLAPALALANGVNALVVWWTFSDDHPRAGAAWLAALAVLLALLVGGWWRWRERRPAQVSRRALRRAALQAAALALVWSLPVIFWFGGASAGEQVLLACIASGMMAGGAFVLVPLPLSSLTYVSVLAVGGVAALLGDPRPEVKASALLVLSYSGILAWGALAGSRQATALLRSQLEAARQRTIVSVLLQDFEAHAAEALWETGRDGRLTHVSPRLAELLASDAAALEHQPFLLLLHARSAEAAALLAPALDAGRPFEGLRLVMRGAGAEGRHADRRGDGGLLGTSDSATRWWSISGKPLFDEAGHPVGWRGVIADVSAEVQAQARLRHLAHHDALTGLANRLTLNERLAEQLRGGAGGALLVIDLDHFKAVNDSLGHSAGDALLKVVGRRLAGCTRGSDVVARLGGDEFAMLVTAPCATEEALMLAERVVGVLREPIDVAGRPLRVGASIGVALIGPGGSAAAAIALSADELFGRADLALYEAKAAGRGRPVVYADALGERSRRQLALEQGLRQALVCAELALHWQPQVSLIDGCITGAEGLLRWSHPTLGAVPPIEFIAAAERSGQIHELGCWVVDEACREAGRALAGLRVSINVSPAQLRDPRFAEHLHNAMQQHAVAADRIELEITESLFIDDATGAFEQLQALRALGVRIALDDFGTGYSSLAYLRRFPFDTLKIDRAFVSELMLRSDAQAIVRTITQLAAALGMRTIAEGVESDVQRTLVARNGCNEAQGFGIAYPVSAAAFAELRLAWPVQRLPLGEGGGRLSA